MDWLQEVEGSSSTNTWSIATSSGIFDTYGTRAFQQAVSRLLSLKIREVRASGDPSPEGGPPLWRWITPPRPGALIDSYDDLLRPGHRWLAQFTIEASGEHFKIAS